MADPFRSGRTGTDILQDAGQDDAAEETGSSGSGGSTSGSSGSEGASSDATTTFERATRGATGAVERDPGFQEAKQQEQQEAQETVEESVRGAAGAVKRDPGFQEAKRQQARMTFEKSVTGAAGAVNAERDTARARGRQPTETAEQFGDNVVTNPLTGNRVEDELNRAADDYSGAVDDYVRSNPIVEGWKAADDVTRKLAPEPIADVAYDEQGRSIGTRAVIGLNKGVAEVANLPAIVVGGKEAGEFVLDTPGRLTSKEGRKGFNEDVDARVNAIVESTIDDFEARPVETTSEIAGGIVSGAAVGGAAGSAVRKASGGRFSVGSDLSGKAIQTGVKAGKKGGKEIKSFVKSDRGQLNLVDASPKKTEASVATSSDTGPSVDFDGLQDELDTMARAREGEFGDFRRNRGASDRFGETQGTPSSRYRQQDDLPQMTPTNDMRRLVDLEKRLSETETPAVKMGNRLRTGDVEAAGIGAAAGAAAGSRLDTLSPQQEARIDADARVTPRGDLDVRSDTGIDADDRIDTRVDTRTDTDLRVDTRTDTSTRTDTRIDTDARIDTRLNLRADTRQDLSRRQDFDIDLDLESGSSKGKRRRGGLFNREIRNPVGDVEDLDRIKSESFDMDMDL